MTRTALQSLRTYADLTKPLHMREFKGPQTAALLAKMARQNLPFANIWYTKLAFDYGIYYRLMEYLSPGYLERYERTMKQNAGTEFWLRPTAVR